METKPYRIQSPEDIAKDYGGNKQKIAEAMQMGVVDPTAGVLAGMFIDRMRSAQMQEQAPQQTVAQQVFAPPAPMGAPAAPMGPPAGLGATPEAAMMAPPMEAPMPEEAPMGMAAGGMFEAPYMKDGGLSELPIPDGMFDEDRDGSYAGGGIVAFARGDQVSDPLAWMRSSITSPYGKRAAGMHEGLDFGTRGGTPIGSPAPGKVIKVGSDAINGNFVRVLHPDGTSSSYSHLAKPTVQEGQEIGAADVIGLSGNTGRVRGANGGYHLHFGARDAEGNRIDPTDFLRSIAPQTASGKWQQKVPERDLGTAEGQVASVEDIFGRLQQRFGLSEEERASRAKLMARAEEVASDEYQNKMRKDSLWETLATIGFNMASSKSPRLLQAVGEAASAALPGAIASKKERKALKDRGLELMVELGAANRKEAIPLWNMATEAAKTNMLQQQFGQKLALDKEQLDLARDKLDAEIAAAKQRGLSVNETVFAMYMSKDPATKLAAEEWIRINNPPPAATGDAAAKTRQIIEGRDGGTAEGATAKDSDGKTIVFSNGQWMYP